LIKGYLFLMLAQSLAVHLIASGGGPESCPGQFENSQVELKKLQPKILLIKQELEKSVLHPLVISIHVAFDARGKGYPEVLVSNPFVIEELKLSVKSFPIQTPIQFRYVATSVPLKVPALLTDGSEFVHAAQHLLAYSPGFLGAHIEGTGLVITIDEALAMRDLSKVDQYWQKLQGLSIPVLFQIAKKVSEPGRPQKMSASLLGLVKKHPEDVLIIVDLHIGVSSTAVTRTLAQIPDLEFLIEPDVLEGLELKPASAPEEGDVSVTVAVTLEALMEALAIPRVKWAYLRARLSTKELSSDTICDSSSSTLARLRKKKPPPPAEPK